MKDVKVGIKRSQKSEKTKKNQKSGMKIFISH